MKIFSFVSDHGGPFQLRVEQPMRALKRFGVQHDYTSALPSEPNAPGPSLNALVNMLSGYDLVVLQRVTGLDITKMVWQACHFLDIPLIGEWDDSYTSLEKSNPCYYGTAIDNPLLEAIRDFRAQGKDTEAAALMPQLEHSRLVGLTQLTEALGMYDALTVTCEELAEMYRPYNKNIAIFPNQVERVYPYRDYLVEETDQFGRLKPPGDKLGLYTIPAFWRSRDEKGQIIQGAPNRIVRIGYTGTSSHAEDFKTIEDSWVKITKNYADKCWFTYIGDPYFFDKQVDHRQRRQFIPPTPLYSMYVSNIRNLDIGIAPLAPVPFNMAKSELKALEYGMWGIPAILPNFITYSRAFVHQENCLMYNNSKEFYACCEELLNNHALRQKLGAASMKYVAENRLQDQHAQERFEFYNRVIASKKKSKQYQPKELQSV